MLIMKELKFGFTTGSCAAAAAKAAAYMLLSGNIKERIGIETPKGIIFDAEILEIQRSEDSGKCAVRKDGGDDPDVTTGLLIFAEVKYRNPSNSNNPITITGGEGIGVVTKPGLDQPVGNHAINSVPREMIRKEVGEVLSLWGSGNETFEGDILLDVIISAPGGEEIAKKTFNPRLGIEGGISIIGTTGIVEPMSVEALIDTIKVELRQKRAEGNEVVSVAPGAYGLKFMLDTYGFDLDRSVKCSNYIGATCDEIIRLGFKKMLLVGHAGKLVKIAGGIMNTHSHEADSRMEIIAASALREGASKEVLQKILDSNTTEEAFGYLDEEGLLDRVSSRLVSRIIYYLDKRLGGDIKVQCIMFVNDKGILGISPGAKDLIEDIKTQWKNEKEIQKEIQI